MSYAYSAPTSLVAPAIVVGNSVNLSWGPSGLLGDPALLLHMDGASGSTSFLDSSSNNFPVTANGGAKITTTTVKFGTGAYDGTSGNSYLSIPIIPNTGLDFAGGDFTVEFWIYPPNNASASGTTPFSIGQLVAGGQYYITSYLGANPGLLTINVSNTAFQNYGINIGAWNHVAICVQGNSLYGFINGVGNGTITTNPITIPPVLHGALSGQVTIGASLGSTGVSGFFPGYIDEFRIRKGVATYTANFTPPSAPFSNLGPSPPGYDVYRNGVSVGHSSSTSFSDYLPGLGTYTYTVQAWDGVSTDVSAPSNSQTTQFVGITAYKPVLLVDASGIEPRIYMPKENVTVQA